jgi:hypothetical protein
VAEVVFTAAFSSTIGFGEAAPEGILPMKQLSHTFCAVVLWIWGMICFFWRWSEHTTLPHLRQ